MRISNYLILMICTACFMTVSADKSKTDSDKNPSETVNSKKFVSAPVNIDALISTAETMITAKQYKLAVKNYRKAKSIVAEDKDKKNKALNKKKLDTLKRKLKKEWSDDIHQSAMNAYKAKQYEKALKLAVHAKKINPENAETLKPFISLCAKQCAMPQPKRTGKSIATSVSSPARLRVVQERYFPTSWSEPTISTSTGGNVVITAPVPQFGDKTDLGTVINVGPPGQSRRKR
jgi:tetratricopeptide (TPR) repeat protein